MVRRDILDAIVRTVADDGRTAIFSSHLLDEVERMSDHVTLIHQGRVALSGVLDDHQGLHRAVARARRTDPACHPLLTTRRERDRHHRLGPAAEVSKSIDPRADSGKRSSIRPLNDPTTTALALAPVRLTDLKGSAEGLRPDRTVDVVETGGRIP
jgi:ABC-type multidrug transport system ATPase subunit